MNSKLLHKRWLVGLIYLVLALAFNYIYLRYKSLFIGQDSYFHISRINEMLHWKLTQFPYLSTATQGHVGDQIALFYPNYLLYPLAALIKVLGHPIFCVYLYVTIMSLITALITDYATYSITKSRSQSFLMATIYTFSFFRLLNFYARFDFGEFLAITFLPLTFAGFYHLLKDGSHRWQLIWGMTGLIYTHTMTTAITGVILVGILIVYLIFHFRKSLVTLKNLLIASLWTGGLTAAFILPLIWHSHYTISGIQATYWQVDHVFSSTWDELFNSVLANDPTIVYSPGTFSVIVGLISILILVVRWRHLSTIYKYSLCCALIFLWMITPLFPWSLFDHTPVLVIQLSLRFCSFYVLFASLLISYVGAQAFSVHIIHKFLVPFLSILSILLALGSVQNTANQRFTKEQKYLQNDLFFTPDKIPEANNVPDYFPKVASKYQADLTDLRNSTAYINGHPKTLYGTPASNQMTYQVKTHSKQNTIDLPFLNYGTNNYSVTNNGHQVSAQFSHRGTFKINTTSPNNKIVIRYQPNFIDRYAKYLSLLILLLALLVGVFHARVRSKNYRHEYHHS
ncbi:hypothetical protein HU830_08205 [Lactobacillus sp. DCY120]|uniref:Membrane protein 6-pyruvoyl-tetrahydropterin synthase-related domain-containing protein n=1 Tax=Bombilactobacillus apium TaxID=2675299 RepID=A0A850R559_9LACO|nr:hypothetical protein [Bombilactobacillus apium]NVY97101.1 hypothetical protein [Bombilactobacillus apium]